MKKVTMSEPAYDAAVRAVEALLQGDVNIGNSELRGEALLAAVATDCTTEQVGIDDAADDADLAGALRALLAAGKAGAA